MENKKPSKTKLDNQNSEKNDTKPENNNTSPPKNKNQNSKSNNKSTQKNEIKNEIKKSDDEDDFVLPVKTIKRSNSIKLYKRHKKEQERRNSLKKENEKDTRDKSGDIFNVAEAEGAKKSRKSSTNLKPKKVAFLPNYVTIIDVESYKKFNAENTCKDPFENMEIINGHINIKNNDDDEDGKTRVLCSCSIY